MMPRPILLVLVGLVGLTSQALARPAVTPAAVAAIRQSLESTDPASYAAAEVDLNGDGRNEVVAYITGAGLCGSGGCSAVILTPSGSGYRVVTQTSVTQLPIRVLTTRNRGWLDLAVGVGGGGRHAAMARLKFDGAAYPDNPTDTPTVRGASGRVLIPEGDRGRNLP